MKEILCNAENYRKATNRKIKYLVIHYTANDGDTAQDNLKYFANHVVKASAHYFIDAQEVGRSVPEQDIAWHCGASSYRHPECRNENSIGIELCSRKNTNGTYEFAPQTVARAVAFVRDCMARYDIPVSHVLRHYDVTGKKCPAPFVDEPSAWKAFLAQLEEPEKRASEPPSGWASAAAAWAVEQGLFQGDQEGDYAWKENLSRQALAVILKRFAERYHLS